MGHSATYVLGCPILLALNMNSIQEFCKPATRFSWWADWFLIIVGCLFVATGFVFFINPYNLVPGGIYGLSIVIHNLLPSVQVGTISYAFEIPLLIISFLLLGSKMGIRTIVAAMITPLLMNGLSILAYPSVEALQALDCTQICNGKLDLSDHMMLTTIIGAATIGLGCGIIARQRATGGGTDIVAMLMQKYLHIRYSRSILFVDAFVVLCGFIVIGIGIGDKGNSGDCYLSFYSLIAIYISARVLSIVIKGIKDEQIIFVIGEGRMDQLREYILSDLERSATCIKSSGLYTGKEKDMLFLVVKEKEVTRIKQIIKAAEPNSFVVITDAYDTYGEGFRNLPSTEDITPE